MHVGRNPLPNLQGRGKLPEPRTLGEKANGMLGTAGAAVLGFFGEYFATRGIDSILSIFRRTGLDKEIQACVDKWIEGLPPEHSGLHADAVFRHDAEHPGPARVRMLERVKDGTIPTVTEIEDALVEAWHTTRRNGVEHLVPFFHLHDDVARQHLGALARSLKTTLAQNQQLFQADTHARLAAGTVNHKQEIAIAREKLESTEFLIGAKALAFKRSLQWHSLDSDDRFALLIGLGDAHRILNEFSTAAVAYLAAFELRPSLEEARVAEVLAYVLQDRIDLARARVATYCGEDGDSVRLRKMEIALCHAEDSPETLSMQIPERIRHHRDILLALSNHAHKSGNKDVAVDLAEQARAAGSKQLYTFMILADALQSKHRSVHPSMLAGNLSPEARSELERVCQMCDEGLRHARGAPIEDETRLALMLHKADALLAMGESAAASEAALVAHSTFPNHPASKHAYAKWLAETNNLPEAIRILRGIIPETEDPNVQLKLAHLLLLQGGADAQGEAAALAAELLRDGLHPVRVQVEAQRVAIEAMVAQKRFAEAATLLDYETQVPGHLTLLQKAVLAVEAGEHSTALDLASGVAQHAAILDDYELLRLGEVFARCEAFDEATSVLRRARPRYLSRTDSLFVMRCLVRVEADADVLALAKTFRERFGDDAGLLSTELVSLERSDPGRAYEYMQRYLTVHPEDRRVRLRKSWLGVRTGHPEWIERDPALLPDPNLCELEEARASTYILQMAGKPDAALQYAWTVLRRNPDSQVARDAFLHAIYGGVTEPAIPRGELAEVDSAVTLVDDLGTKRTVVLEEAPMLRYPFEDVGVSSTLGASLLGRRVADSVQLGGLVARQAKVLHVEHKYFAWIRELSNPLQFDGGSGVMTSIPVPEELASVKALAKKLTAGRRDATHGIVATYCREAALPVHAAATAMRQPVFDLVFGLLSGERGVLKADLRRPVTELDADVGSDTFVLDCSSVATLTFLRMLPRIVASGIRLAITTESLSSIRRMLLDPKLHRPHLSLQLSGLDLAAVDNTADSLIHARKFIQDIIDILEQSFIVVPAMDLDRFSTSGRSDMIEAFGRGGLETIAVATATGTHMVADDFAECEFARRLGGRATTSAALLHAVCRAGLIDKDADVSARAQLLRSGYLGAGVTESDLTRLLELSGGNVRTAPFSHILQAAATRDIPRPWREDLTLTTVVWALRAGMSSVSRDVVLEDVVRATEVLGLADDSLTALIARLATVLEEHEKKILLRFLRTRNRFVFSR